MQLPKTADALRERIDRGQGAQKVDFPDPSASPLGTDDEAAGNPPTSDDVELAASHELVNREVEVPNDTAERRRRYVGEGGIPYWVWLLFAGLIIGGAALVAFAAS